MPATERRRIVALLAGALCLAPMGASATAPTNLPLFPNGTPPASVRHFGLKPDRGLPIATMPLGEGELVVGAPPKAWRVTYVLPKIGLVWSNFFPSWLPTKFYGQWYYLEDWRAMVWDTSEIGPYRRLEVSNGLDFLECVAHGPMPAGSAYFCPEQPEVVVKHVGAQLRVYFPSGTRNTFLSEDAPGSAVTPGEVRLGRFALVEIARKVAPGAPADDSDGYAAVRRLSRNDFVRNGNGIVQGTGYAPELRLGRITVYDSVPGASGTTRPVQHILLGWRDQNVTTRDCNFAADAEPQCSGGDFCYDGKCSAERAITQAQECYDWFCGSYWSERVRAYFTSSGYHETCAQELCDGQAASSTCWQDREPCFLPPPIEMGDPKLNKIVLPQRVDPSSTRSLVYTLHYNVAALTEAGGNVGGALPEAKFLDHIEDNRIELGAGQNFTAQPPHFGNTIQIGYEKLYSEHPLRLKSLSFEKGRDREAFQLEFTIWGLLQRMYGDRQTPFAFRYQRVDPAGPTRVDAIDPFGLVVSRKYEAVGAVGALTPCDPEAGCDIQLGLVWLQTAERAVSTYAYAPSGGAQGNLERVVAVDGTETRYVLDQTLGFAKELWKSVGGTRCMTEVYEHEEPAFPTAPTKATFYVHEGGAMKRVRTAAYDLCAEGKADCPPYEWGQVRQTTMTYARGAPVIQSTAHRMGADGFGATTTFQDGTVTAVVANIAAREPVFGRPRDIETPGVRTSAARTPEPSTASNPVVSSSATPTNVACDANDEYCGGVDMATTSIESVIQDYWQTPDEPMQAALDVLGLTPPDGAGRTANAVGRSMGGLSVTESSGIGSGQSTTESNTYATGTGNLTDRAVTRGGFVYTIHNEWMQVDVPTSAGTWQQRNHPSVVLEQKAWSGAAGDPVFAGGSYQCFSSWAGADCAPPGADDDHTNSTHLGPLARGHYRADGVTKAPPDWILTQDPRVARYPVIGCPSYNRQVIWGGSSCWSDGDCACGCYCDLDYDPMWPEPGTCRCGGILTPATDFVCRQTFLLDPKVVQDFNNLSPWLHSDLWFKEQCAVTSCSGSSNYCDNPEAP